MGVQTAAVCAVSLCHGFRVLSLKRKALNPECMSRRAQIEHLARTNPELHAQLLAVVRERGSEAGALLHLLLSSGRPAICYDLQSETNHYEI